MAKTIEYKMPKDKMIRLIKKSITKFALVKDKGNVLSFGAPNMTCNITINDTNIEFKAGGLFGGTVVDQCYNDVQMAYEDWVEEHGEEAAAPAPAAPVAAPTAVEEPKPSLIQLKQVNDPNHFDPDLEMKRVEIVLKYKELLDKGAITEEEFNKKKTQILFEHTL